MRRHAAPPQVFVNCAFDHRFQPMFRAIVFAIHDCGAVARCALEIDDSAENRFGKIIRIIGECRYSVHDLSRTQLDAATRLPRFNMPFELGLFLGARHFGGPDHRRKSALILDAKRYRYQKFLSDIAGHDIRAHANKTAQLIGCVRDWLSSAQDVPGTPPRAGIYIFQRYRVFTKALPTICRRLALDPARLTFGDFSWAVAQWLQQNAPEPKAVRRRLT